MIIYDFKVEIFKKLAGKKIPILFAFQGFIF